MRPVARPRVFLDAAPAALDNRAATVPHRKAASRGQLHLPEVQDPLLAFHNRRKGRVPEVRANAPCSGSCVRPVAVMDRRGQHPTGQTSPLAVPAAAATARAAAAVRPEPAPPARPSGRFPTMAGVVGVCLAIGCLVSGSLGFLLGRLTAPAPQQVASAPGPTGGTKDSTTHPASAAPKVEPPDNKKDAKPTADDSAPTPPAKPLPVKAKPYVANLANKNPDVRRTALLNLGAMGMDAEAAVPDVIRALDDPEWRVREAAIDALAALGPAARTAAPALLEMYHSDVACRAEIVCKIGYIVPDNDDVVDLLISAAKGGAGPFRFGPFEPAKDFRPYSECSDACIQALQALGHMKNAKAIEFVITVLEKSWKDVLAGNINSSNDAYIYFISSVTAAGEAPITDQRVVRVLTEAIASNGDRNCITTCDAALRKIEAALKKPVQPPG